MKKVMKDILLKLIFNILKNYMNFMMIFSFSPDRKKIEKVEKLVANFDDKTEQGTHIKHLKQVLSHGLDLKKLLRII